MTTVSRREFLKSAAVCTTAAGFLSAVPVNLRANPLGMPIGCQTWPVRDMIAKDFPGTIKQLADAGFQTIELCSPVGYADSGFAGLAKYKGPELRRILADAGVELRQLAFRNRGTPRKSGARNCLGERCRPDANDGAEPGWSRESDHGRCEEGRRRIQQNGRTVGQGRHPAGPPQ